MSSFSDGDCLAMDLTEHQAKKILLDAGVRVPKGQIARSAEEARNIVTSLNLSDCVVKAQIRAGGRSQGHFKNDSQARGGIRFGTGEEQVRASASQMLNNVLLTNQTGPAGELVHSVYVEERIELQSENYLALTIDNTTGSLVFIASNVGGIGIESLALQSPEKIGRFLVDIQHPLVPEELVSFLNVDTKGAADFISLCNAMLNILINKDATLIELNPFGLSKDGQLTVLDAAITWDDNALFRQGHEEQMQAYDHLHEAEFKAICLGLNYIELDGNIGTVSSGAGLAMAAHDALADAGGKPANFLDIPPSSSVSDIQQALSLVLVSEKINAMLINVIGGGIMRCDAITDALLLANEKQSITVPVVARLAGTNSVLAMQRLNASLPDVFVTNDLASATSAVVEIASKHNTSAGKGDVERTSWWKRAVKSREAGVN